MKIIDEKKLLEQIEKQGIVPSAESRSLEFTDTGGVLGFDFTNLTAPTMGESVLEKMENHRGVEIEMIKTLFDLLEHVGTFPVVLSAYEDEWVDREVDNLESNSKLTPAEKTILLEIDQAGGKGKALEFTAEEKEKAISLLLSQYTIFSNLCCVTSSDKSVLVIVSEDDEISFNTLDEALFHKADRFMREREKNLPFEIIRAGDAMP